MKKSQLNPDYLPPRARELAELIGLGALLILVEWRGGVPIYIPERIRDGHPLIIKIGNKAAQILADNFGSEAIEIPRCTASIRAALHDEIRCRRREGQTESQVALDIGIHGRSVRRICAKEQEEIEEKQESLF